jgi:hypothetical protein
MNEDKILLGDELRNMTIDYQRRGVAGILMDHLIEVEYVKEQIEKNIPRLIEKLPDELKKVAEKGFRNRVYALAKAPNIRIPPLPILALPGIVNLTNFCRDNGLECDYFFKKLDVLHNPENDWVMVTISW